jgi:hypothetical protein
MVVAFEADPSAGFGMIPDVPYRITIRPLAENGGVATSSNSLISRAACRTGRRSRRQIANGLDAMRGWTLANARRGAPDPRADPLRGGMSRRPKGP